MPSKELKPDCDNGKNGKANEERKTRTLDSNKHTLKSKKVKEKICIADGDEHKRSIKSENEKREKKNIHETKPLVKKPAMKMQQK